MDNATSGRGRRELSRRGLLLGVGGAGLLGLTALSASPARAGEPVLDHSEIATNMVTQNKNQAFKALILQTYAHSVLAQPPVNFSAQPGLAKYQESINAGLKAAQGHAKSYLYAVQPDIIRNIANIEAYYSLHNAPTPHLPDSAAASAWADAERANLIASAAHAARHGWPRQSVRFAAILWRYLDIGGHYDDALGLHVNALDAARASGDVIDQATVLDGLGTLHYRRGDYSRAGALFTEALDCYGAAGDRAGQGHQLINLGNVRHQQGRFGEAVHSYRRALALHERAGDRLGMFRAHNNLGNTIRAQGDYRSAGEHLRHALTIIREVGDRDGEAHALDELGFVHLRRGDYSSAAESCQQALDAYREVGSPLGIAYALNSLGAVRLKEGDLSSAARYCEEALAGFRRLRARSGEAETLAVLGAVAAERGDLELAAERHRASFTLFAEMGSEMGESIALNNLGVVAAAEGKAADAEAMHSAALAIAERAGDRYESARAHAGLGNALRDGDPGGADRHRARAMRRFAELGVPEADQLAAQIAAAPCRSCSGSGWKHTSRRSVLRTVAHACVGERPAIRHRCADCGGEGQAGKLAR